MSVNSTRKYTLALAGGYATYPAPYAAYPTVTSGSGAYGSWVEYTASTATEIAIVGITISGGSSSISSVYVAIGTGGAGAETVIATIPLGGATNAELAGAGYYTLPYPVIVAAGTRVALKVASGSTTAIYLALSYIPPGSLA